MRANFMERVLHENAKLEEIDDDVEAWHKSYEKKYTSLAKWLGMSDAEYAKWVENPRTLKDIVEWRSVHDRRKRTVFGTPINPDMGEGRYQDTLRRFRARLAAGMNLYLDDDDTPGCKHTSASWGLCSSNENAAYPDVNDHVFPDRIAEDIAGRRRVLQAPRSPPEGATCPFDRGLQSEKPTHWGCFHRCRLFKPERKPIPKAERTGKQKWIRAPVPTQAQALRMYDELIAQREAKYGRKTTADDNEELWEPKGKLPPDKD